MAHDATEWPSEGCWEKDERGIGGGARGLYILRKRRLARACKIFACTLPTCRTFSISGSVRAPPPRLTLHLHPGTRRLLTLIYF